MSTKIMYLRDVNRKPFGCVAMAADHETKQVKYQFSVLHPNDTFEKELAKKIATGRLLKKPHNVSFAGETSHDIIKAVMQDLSSEACTSARARESATNWLQAPYNE